MSLSRFDRPFPTPAHVPEYQGPSSYWPTSMSLDPHKDSLSKQRRHSAAVNTVCNDDEKRAKIALEYYNKENGTNYELPCALLSNGFKSGGTWVHCNFAACQPNINGTRLFFAEMHEDDVTSCTWTVTACIVLEGNTTVGCSMCSEVIHPTHGFRQGHHKPKSSFQPATCLPASFQPTPEELKPYEYELPKYSHLSSSYLPTSFLPNSYSPTSDLLNPHKHTMSIVDTKAPYAFPSAEQISNTRRKRAGIALEYYNKEKGANYELVHVLVCKSMLSGTWFHCNFTAKPPNSNWDISPKLFFGEICLTTLTATACVILEEGSKTTDACNLCLEVIHPTHGFVKGRDKNDVRFDSSNFPLVPMSSVNHPCSRG